MRKTLGPALAISALLVSSVSSAHGGLVHTMGTVSAIDAKHIEVKAQDGAVVSIQLTTETKYLKGKTAAKASDVAVGERVMVESKKSGSQLLASEVRMGAPSASPTP